MRRITNKDLKALVREYEDKGWQVVDRGTGHLQMRPPKGPPVFFACTPSDHRALLNIRKMFERVERGGVPGRR